MANVIIWTQAYNAEKTLRRAMDSILQQTYSDFEYYVLDNASTDGTGAIIDEYAQKDLRVIPLVTKKNHLRASVDFLPNIFKKSSAKWFVWCDADDQYDITFLEKMIAFAEDNQLDIAASGYRKIDGITDKVIKERVINAPLILQGDDFSKYFVEYRGFTTFIWAKLVSAKLAAKNWSTKKGRHESCTDSLGTLIWFKQAKRAGVFPEMLYDYYQYATSASHLDSYIKLDDYLKFWKATKAYILSYGPISKRNEPFLFAIYLSLFEELFELLMSSSFSPEVQLQYIVKMLKEPHMKEALQYEPAGEFRILASRPQLVERIRDYIIKQQEQSQSKELGLQALNQLNKITKGYK